jgi:hypothetical protein
LDFTEERLVGGRRKQQSAWLRFESTTQTFFRTAGKIRKTSGDSLSRHFSAQMKKTFWNKFSCGSYREQIYSIQGTNTRSS